MTPYQRRYLKLITLSEAKRRTMSIFRARHCGTERVPVDSSLLRVSAEEVKSIRDLPPTAVSAVDGYAVRTIDLDGARIDNPKAFKVVGTLRPSEIHSTNLPSVKRGEAYYVETGAPIPAGSDLVVKVEHGKVDGLNTVRVFGEYPRGKNISSKGEDIRRGEVILRERQVIGPADVALCISCGQRLVKVFRAPSVGVLSVGNELKEFPHAGGGDRHATYNNYSNLLRGYLEAAGATTASLGVCKDDRYEIQRTLENSLRDFDLVCTIAGASVGAEDFTPDAVNSIPGSQEIFHGIRAVPIKPTGLTVVKREGLVKAVVILPAHAVSVALATFTVAIPLVSMLSGLDWGSRKVAVKCVAREEFENGRQIDAIHLVILERAGDGTLGARCLKWGSNLLSSLSRANGFVYLKAGERVPENGSVDVELLGPSELMRIQA